MYWQEAATVGDEPQPPPDEDNDYMLMGQDNEDDKDARTLGMLIESRARGLAWLTQYERTLGATKWAATMALNSSAACCCLLHHPSIRPGSGGLPFPLHCRWQLTEADSHSIRRAAPIRRSTSGFVYSDWVVEALNKLYTSDRYCGARATVWCEPDKSFINRSEWILFHYGCTYVLCRK